MGCNGRRNRGWRTTFSGEKRRREIIHSHSYTATQLNRQKSCRREGHRRRESLFSFVFRRLLPYMRSLNPPPSHHHGTDTHSLTQRTCEPIDGMTTTQGLIHSRDDCSVRQTDICLFFHTWLSFLCIIIVSPFERCNRFPPPFSSTHSLTFSLISHNFFLHFSTLSLIVHHLSYHDDDNSIDSRRSLPLLSIRENNIGTKKREEFMDQTMNSSRRTTSDSQSLSRASRLPVKRGGKCMSGENQNK